MKRHPTIPDLWIAEDGRLYQELAVWPDKAGYRITKYRGQKIRAHVLTCEAYHGPRPFPGAEVRHLNGKPGDDRPENLAWGSRSDNMQDMITHGRSTRGERGWQAKLTLAQAQAIYDRKVAGESSSSLAREFGVSMPTVAGIWKGRVWPQVKR